VVVFALVQLSPPFDEYCHTPSAATPAPEAAQV
jgi:hypothetical protein